MNKHYGYELIIAVRENKTILNDKMPDSFIIVGNYIEAAGLLMAYKAGIDYRSARRPLNFKGN